MTAVRAGEITCIFELSETKPHPKHIQGKYEYKQALFEQISE